MLHQESFFVIFHLGKNYRELDYRLSITEAAIEMFIENSYTQIIPLNIVLLRSSFAQNARAVHQRDFGKVRQAKQIKSIQVYDKW